MGAGDGSGPEHRWQDRGESRLEERGQRELRDEHAADEQCFRYSYVAERRIGRTHHARGRIGRPDPGCARSGRRASPVSGQARVRGERDVLGDRHFLGATLQVELAIPAPCLQPAPQGVPQQLAPL